MAATPQYVGAYGKPWTLNLNTDSGVDNLGSLTASAIQVSLRNTDVVPPVDVVSTGAVVIVTSNPAVITWQPTATDYAVAGNRQLLVQVTFATGPVEYDPFPFAIQAR